MTCLDGLRQIGDVATVLEACAGPDWQSKALTGLVTLVVILAFSAIAAAVVVQVRHR